MLKRIRNTELQVGNIVHFYGARFEIMSTRIVPASQMSGHTLDCMVAMGRWMDGEEVRGYFGRGCKDWNFQGNELATVSIEA